MAAGSGPNQVRTRTLTCRPAHHLNVKLNHDFAHARALRSYFCVQGRFLPYLPQDTAGLAGVQAEMACEIINDELAELLSRPASDLWDTIAKDDSLIMCLETYLRFSRWALQSSCCKYTTSKLTLSLLVQASI